MFFYPLPKCTPQFAVHAAPAPDIVQQQYTSDSRIEVSWNPILEGCSSLGYNYTQSNTCGTCNLARGGNTVICTDGVVGECTLVIQTVVCGVLVNETVLTNSITPSPTTSITEKSSTTTMPTDIITSGTKINVHIPTDTCSYSFLTLAVSLTVKRIAIIVVATVVPLTIIVALITCGVCFYYQRRKKRGLKLNEVYMNKISSD